jgi:hypothetical protein
LVPGETRTECSAVSTFTGTAVAAVAAVEEQVLGEEAEDAATVNQPQVLVTTE